MCEAPAGSGLLLRGSPQQHADIMSKMVASLCVASLWRVFLLGNGSLTHRNETIWVHSLALKPAWRAWSWPCSHTVVWPYKGLVSDGSTSNPTLCSLPNAVPSVLSLPGVKHLPPVYSSLTLFSGVCLCGEG